MKNLLNFFLCLVAIALVSSCEKEPIANPVPIITLPTTITTTTSPTSITTTTAPTSITTTTNDTIGKSKIIFFIHLPNVVTANDYRYDTINTRITLNGQLIACEKTYSTDGSIIKFERYLKPIWMAVGDSLVVELDAIDVVGGGSANQGVAVIFNSINGRLTAFKDVFDAQYQRADAKIWDGSTALQPYHTNKGVGTNNYGLTPQPDWYLSTPTKKIKAKFIFNG